MPRVPTYQDQVQGQGTAPNVVVRAPGQPVIQSAALLQRTSTRISNVALRILSQERARTDNAAVNGATARLSARVGDLIAGPEGAVRVRGEEALPDPTGRRADPRPMSEIYRDHIDDAIKEERGRVMNVGQQQAFDSNAAGIRNRAMLRLHEMQYAQEVGVRRGNYESLLAERKNEVALHAGGGLDSVDEMEAVVVAMENEVELNGIVEGWTPEMISQKIQANRAEAYALGISTAVAQDRITDANAMYEHLSEMEDEHGPALSQEDKKNLEPLLRRATDGQTGLLMFREIQAAHPPPVGKYTAGYERAVMAELDKIDDPVMLDIVGGHTSAWLSQLKKNWDLQEREYANAVYDHVEQTGGSFETVKPHLREALDYEYENSARAFAANLRKPQKRVTNMAKMYPILTKAFEDGTFADMDLVGRYYAWIDDDDLKAWMWKQQTIKSKAGRTKVVTYDQLFNARKLVIPNLTKELEGALHTEYYRRLMQFAEDPDHPRPPSDKEADDILNDIMVIGQKDRFGWFTGSSKKRAGELYGLDDDEAAGYGFAGEMTALQKEQTIKSLQDRNIDNPSDQEIREEYFLMLGGKKPELRRAIDNAVKAERDIAAEEAEEARLEEVAEEQALEDETIRNIEKVKALSPGLADLGLSPAQVDNYIEYIEIELGGVADNKAIRLTHQRAMEALEARYMSGIYGGVQIERVLPGEQTSE